MNSVGNRSPLIFTYGTVGFWPLRASVTSSVPVCRLVASHVTAANKCRYLYPSFINLNHTLIQFAPKHLLFASELNVTCTLFFMHLKFKALYCKLILKCSFHHKEFNPLSCILEFVSLSNKFSVLNLKRTQGSQE